MRIFAAILGVALVLLQYRLWVSDQGVRELDRLQTAIDAQSAANQTQAARNRQLAAEVADLKVGMAAVEERARSELGMIGSNETFYQVVRPSAPATAAPAIAATAAIAAPAVAAIATPAAAAQVE
ncbi:MAG TPA: cell division protein FtsB [Steroidobacteraceae bacterium]|nr:cell division protein FtsB [Steroidobacteraceae bacterium]